MKRAFLPVITLLCFHAGYAQVTRNHVTPATNNTDTSKPMMIRRNVPATVTRENTPVNTSTGNSDTSGKITRQTVLLTITRVNTVPVSTTNNTPVNQVPRVYTNNPTTAPDLSLDGLNKKEMDLEAQLNVVENKLPFQDMAVMTLVSSEANMVRQTEDPNYFHDEIKIDNPICNGNPKAVVFVMGWGGKDHSLLANAFYKAGDHYWYIDIPTLKITGFDKTARVVVDKNNVSLAEVTNFSFDGIAYAGPQMPVTGMKFSILIFRELPILLQRNNINDSTNRIYRINNINASGNQPASAPTLEGITKKVTNLQAEMDAVKNKLPFGNMAVMTFVSDAGNMSYDPSQKAFLANTIKIDNPLCNNDPGATLFVIYHSIETNMQLCTAFYHEGYWRIAVDPTKISGCELGVVVDGNGNNFIGHGLKMSIYTDFMHTNSLTRVGNLPLGTDMKFSVFIFKNLNATLQLNHIVGNNSPSEKLNRTGIRPATTNNSANNTIVPLTPDELAKEETDLQTNLDMVKNKLPFQNMAFMTLVTGDNNLTRQTQRTDLYENKIKIDNPLCNGNPKAIIMVMNQGDKDHMRWANVWYNDYDKYWYIISPTLRLSGFVPDSYIGGTYTVGGGHDSGPGILFSENTSTQFMASRGLAYCTPQLPVPGLRFSVVIFTEIPNQIIMNSARFRP